MNTQSQATQQAKVANPSPPQQNSMALKFQFLQKFISDAQMILDGMANDQAGMARAKLKEAEFWGNQAIAEEMQLQAKIAKLQQLAAAQNQASAPPTPSAPPANIETPAA